MLMRMVDLCAIASRARRRRHAIVVALMVGVLPVAASRALEGLTPPRPDCSAPVDYVAWLNTTAAKGVRDNAYPSYLAAYDKLQVVDGSWPTDASVVDAWLQRNEEALTLFEKATQHADYAFTWNTTDTTGDPRVDRLVASTNIFWLQQHRDSVMGMLARGRRAAQSGDQRSSIRYFLAALRSSQHLYGSRLLLPRVHAIRLADLTYTALLSALDQSEQPDRFAAELAPLLTAADPPIPSFLPNIVVERLSAWDFIQRFFLPGTQGRKWDLHPPLMEWVLKIGGPLISPGMQAALISMGFDNTIRDIDAYFDGLAEWWAIPYHTLPAAEREKTQERMFGHFREDAKNPLVKMFLAPLEYPRRMHEQLLATRRAVHLIVHLHDHRRRTKSFPESLDELQVAGLRQLRLDPFSGKDLIYSRRGQGFRLYCRSHNLVDDGGKAAEWDEDGDHVFWPLTP